MVADTLFPVFDPLKTMIDIVAPASYIVYKEGDTTVVKNAKTGMVEFSDADSATAINYAISKASAEGGGKVFIRAGLYIINSEIRPMSNVVLEGEGWGTWLKQGDDRNLRAVIYIDSQSNVVVRNVHVDGNRAKQTSTSSGINHGIQVTNKCQNIVIENNIVHDAKNLNICCYGGTSTSYSTYITIRGNISYNAGRDGIALDDYHKNIQVLNNIVYNCGDWGIGVARTVQQILIANNVVALCKVGIGIWSYSDYTDIVGNLIVSTSIAGILVEEAKFINISGNYVVGAGNGICLGAARITPYPAHNINVTSNFVYAITHGIMVGAAGAQCTNINISDNYIVAGYGSDNTGDGIQLINALNTVVRNNTIRGLSPTLRVRYGVREDTGSDYNVVDGNLFYHVGTSPVLRSGGNTVIRRNYGYATERSGTATIPAGSTSVVVSHGLAVAPRTVVVTPRGNIGSVWVTDVTSTSFRINCSTPPGENTQVDWYAEA